MMKNETQCVVCERLIDVSRGELKACKAHIREAAIRDVDECAKWGVSMTTPLMRIMRAPLDPNGMGHLLD